LQEEIKMQIYKKILVTIDCSNVDEKIVDHISMLAQQNNSSVGLIHVVHSHTLDQDRALREGAQKSLEKHRKKLQADGVETFLILKSGEPDDEILKEIEKNEYDLVAMATHGHSFIGDLLFGSVSRTLKHQIKIPLLLIGPS